MSNVTDMKICFVYQKIFYQKLFWNTGNVKDILLMFDNCKNFNQPIELDLSRCEKIEEMFLDYENLELKNIGKELLNLLTNKYGTKLENILDEWKIKYDKKEFKKLFNKNSFNIIVNI